MVTFNQDQLIIQSVQGKVQHPKIVSPYRVSNSGLPLILPATGGISYNLKIGNFAFGWAGDHLEPGVTIKNDNEQENAALNVLACIGNTAKVVSGDAKGATGFVTGTHGGVEHVLLYFAPEDLERLAINDQIMIKACGQGLTCTDYPQVKVMNIDPSLFARLGIEERQGRLQIPVAGVVPAHLMGSGVGAATATSGDYDIMTADWEEIVAAGLDQLRLGDLVFIQDYDHSFGRGYRKGAVSVGVVIHADSFKLGHGPGVTTIMTSPDGWLEPIHSKEANIAKYLSCF